MAGTHRYSLIVLALLATLAAATIAFNAHVDPYALEAEKASTTEAGPPRGGALHRTVVHARRANARTVILGTSRAQSGLPVDHPVFTEHRRPVVNLALGAASIDQLRLLLIHAHTTSPLAAAVIGLDLEAFLGEGRPDFDPSLLAGNPDSQPTPLSWLRTNVALATLYASVRVRWGIGPATEADGTDPAAQYDSQRSAVWTTEFRNFHSRLPRLFPGHRSSSTWADDVQRQAAIASFGQLLRYARRENIELHLFISPVHARYLDWYRRVGWWPLYEEWKRVLAAEIDREAKTQPGQPAFVLWDMSGFRGPAAETIPPLKDTTTRMHWYLETSHYNDRLGARILDTVMGLTAPESDWPVARIDVGTVNAHLRRLYNDADTWREMNPGETANVAAMVVYLRRQSRH